MVHLAKPNSQPQHQTLRLSAPFPPLAPLCRSRPAFPPHAGLQLTNKTQPGSRKMHIPPRPLSSRLFSSSQAEVVKYGSNLSAQQPAGRQLALLIARNGPHAAPRQELGAAFHCAPAASTAEVNVQFPELSGPSTTQRHQHRDRDGAAPGLFYAAGKPQHQEMLQNQLLAQKSLQEGKYRRATCWPRVTAHLVWSPAAPSPFQGGIWAALKAGLPR